MYFKRIFTESIAHYSYVVGDGESLIVIDPQATIGVYLDIARKKQMKIIAILETHRNEDFLSGSKALAKASGADVYISSYEDLDFNYGKRIKDGHRFNMNGMSIEAIHTPGHTLGHMAYVLYVEENPYMVFTGDSCFYGAIARADFYGKDKIGEMTGKIYDSIFNKLMPLGEHVIMWPAHGAGSACGENIEDRPYSTLGYEKRNNPKLQYDNKEEFVDANAKQLFKPGYFSYMENMNLKGVGAINPNPSIKMKSIEDINFDVEYVVDIRNQHAFNKVHIPGSIFFPKGNITGFINWIIPREGDICLVTDASDDLKEIYIDLQRIGYTGEISFLAGGINSWFETKEVEEIKLLPAKDYKNNKDKYFILDVRKASETNVSYGDKGIRIALEEIVYEYEKIRNKKNVLVVCPSGIRSNIAASFLKSKGIDANLLLGGLKAVKKS